MPASFADDGALGGGNFGDASIGPTSTLSSPSLSTPSPSAPVPSASETIETGAGIDTGGDGGSGPTKRNPLAGGGATTPSGQDPIMGMPGWANQFTQNTGGPQRVLAYEDGGPIEDSQGGDPLLAKINKALGTVDSVLDYGRNLHGLGGGDNTQSGGVQTADAGYSNGRMPAIPGSQSNSGVPPIQPQPGPLPPTSNPFGKRADASDSTDQDSSGGVDTGDEESA
jgi:hypothetical protein